MTNLAQKALLIDPDGRVLVLKSSKPDGEGNAWDFPGGRGEDGEMPLETLRREVKEEIGVEIDVTRAEILHSGSYKGFGTGANDEVNVTFWIVPVVKTEITLSWEHSEYHWFALDDAGLANFTGRYREVFDLYVLSTKT